MTTVVKFMKTLAEEGVAPSLNSCEVYGCSRVRR